MGTLGKTVLGALVAAVIFVGCGGTGAGSSGGSQTGRTSSPAARSRSSTKSATSTSATNSSAGPTFDLTVKSPVKTRPLPSRYTCDGTNVSPPISWSSVPEGTAEVALFIYNAQPVHGKNFADWAVAGLAPGISGIHTGKLPADSIVARNSLGKASYSLCPPKGPGTEYLVIVYALPNPLGVRRGISAEALRKMAVKIATHAGFLNFEYERH